MKNAPIIFSISHPQRPSVVGAQDCTKTKNSPTQKKYLLPLLLILLTLPLEASASASQTSEFESQLAMTQLLSATTPSQFDSAAKTLKQVIDSGSRNAPLFYNYGTALLMAEQPQVALNAFIRSEHFSGTTWELKRNMLLAISNLNETITNPTLPWYRTPLFWHYGLAAQTRLTIASLAFLTIWLTIIMRKTRFKKNHHIILGIAITLLIIFGSSAATTLYQEHNPLNPSERPTSNIEHPTSNGEEQ